MANNTGNQEGKALIPLKCGPKSSCELLTPLLNGMCRCTSRPSLAAPSSITLFTRPHKSSALGERHYASPVASKSTQGKATQLAAHWTEAL